MGGDNIKDKIVYPILFVLILFLFISLMGISFATDMSTDELNMTDGGSLSVPISDSADDSSLSVSNDDEILSATHDFSGSTVGQLKTLIEGGTVQPGDTIYLGNQDISSTWTEWDGNQIINVNVPNVVISGGSSSNPNGISTINANFLKLLTFALSQFL